MEIWLYLDFKGITQHQWDIVWNECHEVLQCFPVSLGVLDGEKKWGSERNVWNTKLVHGDGDEECLCVQTDMASLAFGGKFRLYRSIAQYSVSDEHSDILWVNEDDIDSYGSRCRIWENRTRGAGYTVRYEQSCH